MFVFSNDHTHDYNTRNTKSYEYRYIGSNQHCARGISTSVRRLNNWLYLYENFYLLRDISHCYVTTSKFSRFGDLKIRQSYFC